MTLPYALSDKFTVIASVPIDEILAALLDGGEFS